jgi:uncharacterized metal-binding protein
VSANPTKVGIISCSGESIPEGTIARLATRRVLELLRPDVTVTLCLPLFLAGNEGERNFARTHPTITVDGCAKQCAKWGTEQHSWPVNAAIVVSDLLGTSVESCHRSSRDTAEDDKTAVWSVAERIASEVDAVLEAGTPGVAIANELIKIQCACSSPIPGGTVMIRGTKVSIPGLPAIFEQCVERGIPSEGEDGRAVLDTVKVYHAIAPDDESEFRSALLRAYREFRSGASGGK